MPVQGYVSAFADILEAVLCETDAAREAEAAPRPVPAASDWQLDWAVAVPAPERAQDAGAPEWARALGVAPDANEFELRAAFRRLAFATHPDRAGGSHEAFLRVQALFACALAAQCAGRRAPPRAYGPSSVARQPGAPLHRGAYA